MVVAAGRGDRQVHGPLSQVIILQEESLSPLYEVIALDNGSEHEPPQQLGILSRISTWIDIRCLGGCGECKGVQRLCT